MVLTYLQTVILFLTMDAFDRLTEARTDRQKSDSNSSNRVRCTLKTQKQKTAIGIALQFCNIVLSPSSAIHFQVLLLRP